MLKPMAPLAALLLATGVGAGPHPTGPMTQEQRITAAAELMTAFAERTRIGETGGTRYLWTDAFAVCNYLGLVEATGDTRYRELANALIESVHHQLGHHRSDDPRTGWLAGPAGAADPDHPTRGGLRIGKALPERDEAEPFNDHLEWERDGQYFHYLTRWMHALNQAAVALDRPRLNRWARELAATAHRAFVFVQGRDARRMYWKMSIDLSRPLVPSMGQHDPLDGYVTALELVHGAADLGSAVEPDLAAAVADYAAMLQDGALVTSDPLGIGGLLIDAARLERLMHHDDVVEAELLERLLRAAGAGLQRVEDERTIHGHAAQRLAFRELGLAIGLAAVQRMARAIETGEYAGSPAAARAVDGLREYLPLREEIERFWLKPDHQEVGTWSGHRDINSVMLATSLLPDGYLD